MRCAQVDSPAWGKLPRFRATRPENKISLSATIHFLFTGNSIPECCSIIEDQSILHSS